MNHVRDKLIFKSLMGTYDVCFLIEVNLADIFWILRCFRVRTLNQRFLNNLFKSFKFDGTYGVCFLRFDQVFASL